MRKMQDSDEIGRKIRFFRQNAGLSQEQLAEMVGLSFQQIQKYESGQSTININKLQQIAHSLKLFVTDFFDEKPVDKIILNPQEEELIKIFRQIKDVETKDCILKLVKNLKKKR